MAAWTKLQLINKAFSSLGVAGYVYDLGPEQLQDACADLDALIASWKSMHISYNMSSSPSEADVNASSGLPEYANQAVYLNLAMLLALPLGRTVSPQLTTSAKKAYTELVKNAIDLPVDRQFPGSLPGGAGRKRYDYPYVDSPSDTRDTGPEGYLDSNN